MFCCYAQIIDELQNSIQLLDSTTAVKPPLSPVDNIQLMAVDKTKKIKKKKKKSVEDDESEEVPMKKKFTIPQRYVYLLDKPLEKILIRYIHQHKTFRPIFVIF